MNSPQDFILKKMKSKLRQRNQSWRQKKGHKRRLKQNTVIPAVFLRDSGGFPYLRGKKTPVPAHSFFTPDPPSKTVRIGGSLRWGCCFGCCTCTEDGHAVDWAKFTARPPQRPFSYPTLLFLSLLWIRICCWRWFSCACWAGQPVLACLPHAPPEDCDFSACSGPTCWSCKNTKWIKNW